MEHRLQESKGRLTPARGVPLARTVDPARHAARRLVIIDAALTCFARDGYDGTTTAALCRQAGIGSGTFFHYFPTKLDVLLAALALGTAQTRAWFAAQSARTDAATVLDDWVVHTAAETVDPRLPAFVRAVGAVMTRPEVAAALAADDAATRDGLLPHVRAAAAAGQVRSDLPPERLVTWVQALLDGYLGLMATAEAFEAEAEGAVLQDAVRRLLRP